jgi:hypothetical protein
MHPTESRRWRLAKVATVPKTPKTPKNTWRIRTTELEEVGMMWGVCKVMLEEVRQATTRVRKIASGRREE